MYLIAGLLSNHDKSKFEIYIFSYGKTKTGKYREFAKKNCRKFFDISDSTNKEIYKLSKNCRIDIAIDLKGYTKNTRSDIFSKRVAPIQINYLGYPGTMGVNFMDYIIADYTVIPKSQQKNYSEKIIYLPHSYQPNDNNRFVSKTITSKLDFGLPEDSFVFCCFNNNYKISPSEFDIWMRILRNTKNSVLWLFKSNKYADKNIINEAMSRGVDKSRIIFAEKIKVDEHLARHKHADLFLDTFNYNAHTTASDALWSGLPIVTKEGLQFASRVSASLLRSVGMEELITKTEEEYENLIMHLYENKNKLNKIRVELNTNNKNKPLFDTKQYTLDLEESFKRVFEIEINGKDKQNVLI